MRIFLGVLPIALLVAYSQIMVKWRTMQPGAVALNEGPFLDRVLQYLSDPLLLSAYVTALAASFLWLMVVAKLPLVVAFPVYIGVTFVLVLFGGWLFLSESMDTTRLLAAGLILLGITLGVRS